MAAHPERFEATIRRSVDRWVGTSRRAIHLRLAASVALFALASHFRGFKKLETDLIWAATTTAWAFVVPGLRDLERVYGTRLVAGAVFLLVLGVPLAFAAAFTALALLSGASTFASPGASWVARAICAVLALGGWWAVFRVLRVRGEFARLLRAR